MVKFNRYHDYFAGELAICWINENSATTHLEYVKAIHLSKAWSGSSADRVAVQKADATTNPDVVAVQKVFNAFKAKRIMYTSMVEGFARDAQVVSRELSRRIGNRDVDNRSNRFTP